MEQHRDCKFRPLTMNLFTLVTFFLFATPTIAHAQCINLASIDCNAQGYKNIKKSIEANLGELDPPCAHNLRQEIKLLGGRRDILLECEAIRGGAGCIDQEVWKTGFELNGCTVDSIVQKVDSFLTDECPHDAITELQLIFGVKNNNKAKKQVEKMCKDGWKGVDITRFKDIDPRFKNSFMEDYINGDSFLNLETGTFQGTVEGENIKSFRDDKAQSTLVTGFNGLKGCKLNSMMCCFGRDRQPNDNNGNCADPIEENCIDADPADNSNLCYTEFDGAIYPGESEGDIHCHGLAWADDAGDFTNQLKYNNFFFVSLYDHMYQRGYVENTLETNDVPMCACMEDMDITVSRADCTQIDAKLTFTIKYENSALVATAGDDLHVDFNSCQGTNPSNGHTQSNDLASYVFRLYEDEKIKEETKDTVFDTLVGYAEPGNNANEEACIRAYDEEFGDDYHTPTDDWLQVFGKGLQEDFNKTYLDLFGPGSPYLPRGGDFYIRRLCPNCRDSHKDIVYKRLTPLPGGFNIADIFLGEWVSENNKLKAPGDTQGDFELYGNMLDALAGRNAWKFCNYDDNVGFPRDCGPEVFVGGQWNSLTRGGQKDYGFYVYRGNVSPEPPLAPPEDEDSLTQWTQVFGAGSKESPDTDLTLFGPESLYLPREGGFYIRRLCPDCRESHTDIVYKRLTSLPDGFNIANVMLGEWASENNKLNIPGEEGGDFELYGSMNLALASVVPWTFCNYDDHVGFPRDCGPNGHVGGQWNSLNGRGQADYSFYVWNGNLQGQPPPTPNPQDEDAMTQWTQVFGAGSQESPDTDLTLFGPESLYLPRAGNFYVRRLCPSCADSHKSIVYKRVSPLPAGFDISEIFIGEWASQDNTLKTIDNPDGDFELYSSMNLALVSVVPWSFCNYDDHVGFPRDCGPSRFVGGQWNSLTRGGQSDYGFYVWNGNPDL